MDRNTVFQKTAAGQEEIAARTHKDLARLRPVLIMVDGKTSVDALLVTAGKFCDVADALGQLLTAGLIEVANAAPATSAVPAARAVPTAESAPSADVLRGVARALYDALGPHADDFAMRIEKCRTHAELVQLVEKCRYTVQQVAGRRKAEEFLAAVSPKLLQTP